MKLKKIFGSLAVLIVLVGSLLFSNVDQFFNFSNEEYIGDIESGSTLVEGIDVGQADSFLISNDEFGNILIDTGDSEHGESLVNHLKMLGIEKIDYLILTHPHSDHIGGVCDVLDNFEVGDIYMPKMTHNTTSFRNMVEKVEEKGLKFKQAKSGVKIKLDDNSQIDIISPTKDMSLKDMDNSDAVCVLKTNGRKVLFTADIFKESETRLMDRIGKIDILKVAHHGSYKATSNEFLNTVKPSYAVIGVGEDNSYNHPSKQTLQRLEEHNVKVYRTDLDGNIAFIIDKDGNIDVKTSK